MIDIKRKMTIAVIGSGISGLGAAWVLAKKHNVTVYEADTHYGGHANTTIVEEDEKAVPIDTGFIVCNDKNYPTFLALLDHLKVPYADTDMSFGVSIGDGDFEYAGADNLGPLFAQKSNILRPRFWSMIKSLLRFYKETSALDVDKAAALTLNDFLLEGGYSAAFIRDHILPMAASVWSTPSEKVGDFPLKSFLRFCQNHGLLQVSDRPQWHTLLGGSRNYVAALRTSTPAKFHLNNPVVSIVRDGDQTVVTSADGISQKYDRVVMAVHADTALSLLTDADDKEKDILGRFTYADNLAVLHSDARLMPKRKQAWSSWNYLQPDKQDASRLSVTYWMNKLQPLDTEKDYFVTLNPAQDIPSDLVHYSKSYSHPIFDLSTLSAQHDIHDLMGHRGIWYAGAHMGYGFHEDGLQSGLHAAELAGQMTRPDFIPKVTDRLVGLAAPTTYKPARQERQAAE